MNSDIQNKGLKYSNKKSTVSNVTKLINSIHFSYTKAIFMWSEYKRRNYIPTDLQILQLMVTTVTFIITLYWF